MPRDFPQLLERDQNNGLLAVERRLANRLAKARLETLHQFVIERSRFRRRFFRWQERRRRLSEAPASAGAGRRSAWFCRSSCVAGVADWSAVAADWLAKEELGVSGLAGIEALSAVLSGGFAAGSFFRRVVDHRFDRLPLLSARQLLHARNRLAARLFNTLQKTTSIPSLPESQRLPRRTKLPRSTPNPARPSDTTTHTRSAKSPRNTNIVTKPYNAQLPVLDRPGKQKNRLHVENHEQNRHDIKPHRIAPARIALPAARRTHRAPASRHVAFMSGRMNLKTARVTAGKAAASRAKIKIGMYWLGIAGSKLTHEQRILAQRSSLGQPHPPQKIPAVAARIVWFLQLNYVAAASPAFATKRARQHLAAPC